MRRWEWAAWLGYWRRIWVDNGQGVDDYGPSRIEYGGTNQPKGSGHGSETKLQEIHHYVHSHSRFVRAGLGYRLRRKNPARDDLITGFQRNKKIL